MSQSWVSRSPVKAAMSYRVTGTDAGQLPLVDCPFYGKRVIRLQSKKPRSYGAFFFKCEENEQDDPTSCRFYKWEKDYRKWLEANYPEYVDVPREEEQEEQKLAFVQLKHEIGLLSGQIAELKHLIVVSRTKPSLVKTGVVGDSVCVVSALVGCMVEILVAMLLK